MKASNEWKRAKATGKGAKAQHLGIAHWIIDREEFKALKGQALNVLVHLGRQYNGFNNGDLCIKPLRMFMRSRDTLQRVTDRLQHAGWLIKTRRGGLGLGPDLYAISWWPIDKCKGKHDYPEESVPSHLWMKNRPARKSVLLVPEIGTSEVEIEQESSSVVPKIGTRNDVFRVA